MPRQLRSKSVKSWPIFQVKPKKLARKELQRLKHTYDDEDEDYSSTSKRLGNLEPFSSRMIVSTVFSHLLLKIFRDLRADVIPSQPVYDLLVVKVLPLPNLSVDKSEQLHLSKSLMGFGLLNEAINFSKDAQDLARILDVT